MPAPSTELASELITRARNRLNEELDTGTNLWSDTELLEYLNEGVREVWQTVRESHENWFIRSIRSDAGASIPIRGRAYDPTLLQLQSGRDEIILPPDFFELRLFEAVPQQTDATIRRAVFLKADLSAPAFRDRVLDTTNESTQIYFYDIEQRSSGPVMVFAGIPVLDQSIDVIIKYVADAPEMQTGDSFEDTGFTKQMVDAVLSFMVYKAREKEQGDVTPEQALKMAAGEWERKRTVSLRGAGPRQTRDPEVVQGYLEDDLY